MSKNFDSAINIENNYLFESFSLLVGLPFLLWLRCGEGYLEYGSECGKVKLEVRKLILKSNPNYFLLKNLD